ncbi:MAG TPA: hypothetical protein VF518_06100, partial [Polyangia bacterium]
TLCCAEECKTAYGSSGLAGPTPSTMSVRRDGSTNAMATASQAAPKNKTAIAGHNRRGDGEMTDHGFSRHWLNACEKPPICPAKQATVTAYIHHGKDRSRNQSLIGWSP